MRSRSAASAGSSFDAIEVPHSQIGHCPGTAVGVLRRRPRTKLTTDHGDLIDDLTKKEITRKTVKLKKSGEEKLFFLEETRAGAISRLPKNNPRLAQIVGRHRHVHLIAHTDANEVFAHLSRNVREHFMAIRQGDPKHGAGQNLAHGAFQLNWLFLRHKPSFYGNSAPSCNWILDGYECLAKGAKCAKDRGERTKKGGP